MTDGFRVGDEVFVVNTGYTRYNILSEDLLWKRAVVAQLFPVLIIHFKADLVTSAGRLKNQLFEVYPNQIKRVSEATQKELVRVAIEEL